MAALLAKKCVQRMHVINCVCRGATPHDLPSTEKVVRTLEFDQQVAMKKDLMKELAELESLLEKRLRTVELMRMSHHPSIMHEAPCTSDEPSMHEIPRSTVDAPVPEVTKNRPADVLPSKPLQSYELSIVYLEQKTSTHNMQIIGSLSNHLHGRFRLPRSG